MACDRTQAFTKILSKMEKTKIKKSFSIFSRFKMQRKIVEKSAFNEIAEGLNVSIKSYKRLLIKNEAEYTKDLRYIETREFKMTHDDRLMLEENTNLFIQKANDEIIKLNDYAENIVNSHSKIHHMLIIAFLRDCLNLLSDKMSQMRKKREINYLKKGYGLKSFDNYDYSNRKKRAITKKHETNYDNDNNTNGSLIKILESKSQVQQIANVLASFNKQITHQHSKIELLHTSAEDSLLNYSSANQNLLKASNKTQLFEKTNKMFIFILAGLCLLFLDWFS